jgi:hypothetical protein
VEGVFDRSSGRLRFIQAYGDGARTVWMAQIAEGYRYTHGQQGERVTEPVPEMIDGSWSGDCNGHFRATQRHSLRPLRERSDMSTTVTVVRTGSPSASPSRSRSGSRSPRGRSLSPVQQMYTDRVERGSPEQQDDDEEEEAARGSAASARRLAAEFGPLTIQPAPPTPAVARARARSVQRPQRSDRINDSDSRRRSRATGSISASANDVPATDSRSVASRSLSGGSGGAGGGNGREAAEQSAARALQTEREKQQQITTAGVAARSLDIGSASFEKLQVKFFRMCEEEAAKAARAARECAMAELGGALPEDEQLLQMEMEMQMERSRNGGSGGMFAAGLPPLARREEDCGGGDAALDPRVHTSGEWLLVQEAAESGRLRPEVAHRLATEKLGGLIVEVGSAEAERAMEALKSRSRHGQRGHGVGLADFVRWWGEYGALHRQAVPTEHEHVPRAFPLGPAGVGRDGEVFRTQRGPQPLPAAPQRQQPQQAATAASAAGGGGAAAAATGSRAGTRTPRAGSGGSSTPGTAAALLQSRWSRGGTSSGGRVGGGGGRTPISQLYPSDSSSDDD